MADMICPYCAAELQPGTIESVHAIYWCPDSQKPGIFLPRKRKDAELISPGKLFFYAAAKKCPKCQVIILDPPESWQK